MSSSSCSSTSSSSHATSKPTPFLGGNWTAGGPDGSFYWSEKALVPAVAAPDEDELAYYVALLHSMRASKAEYRPQEKVFVRNADPVQEPSVHIPESFVRGGDGFGVGAI